MHGYLVCTSSAEGWSLLIIYFLRFANVSFISCKISALFPCLADIHCFWAMCLSLVSSSSSYRSSKTSGCTLVLFFGGSPPPASLSLLWRRLFLILVCSHLVQEACILIICTKYDFWEVMCQSNKSAVHAKLLKSTYYTNNYNTSSKHAIHLDFSSWQYL